MQGSMGESRKMIAGNVNKWVMKAGPMGGDERRVDTGSVER